jgi:hypothetical protein
MVLRFTPLTIKNKNTAPKKFGVFLWMILVIEIFLKIDVHQQKLPIKIFTFAAINNQTIFIHEKNIFISSFG